MAVSRQIQRRKQVRHAHLYEQRIKELFLGTVSSEMEMNAGLIQKLFHRLVDYATVYSDGRLVFTFRNGVGVSTKI